jgi:hypothetical protein
VTRFEQTGPPGTARQRCLVAECDYACGSIVVIVVIVGVEDLFRDLVTLLQ